MKPMVFIPASVEVVSIQLLAPNPASAEETTEMLQVKMTGEQATYLRTNKGTCILEFTVKGINHEIKTIFYRS